MSLSSYRIRLLDFESFKRVKQNLHVSGLSQGTITGSEAFMSPVNNPIPLYLYVDKWNVTEKNAHLVTSLLVETVAW